ncbi:MAG TPA: hypothetical protein VIA06_11255 [Candidatus Dormibacteraeota bacterium]|nr:hypothetical protein [Candidatus Dormibacteraeota bacterium]
MPTLPAFISQSSASSSRSVGASSRTAAAPFSPRPNSTTSSGERVRVA